MTLLKSLALGTLIASSLVAENKASTNSKKAEPVKVGSYSIGYQIGNDFKQNKELYNLDEFIKGLKDSWGDKKSLYTKAEIDQAYAAMRKKAESKANQAVTVNLDAGQKFLTENKAKDGVKVTASGLQYKVLKAGTGASPAASDSVKVHYHGTLIDGKVFDSSIDRGESITFPLNGVIKGWTEGLQLMKEGGEYMFYIPNELAYGKSQRSPGGPGTALVFKVQLLEVVKK